MCAVHLLSPTQEFLEEQPREITACDKSKDDSGSSVLDKIMVSGAELAETVKTRFERAACRSMMQSRSWFPGSSVDEFHS
jgi:hypothetical protein